MVSEYIFFIRNIKQHCFFEIIKNKSLLNYFNNDINCLQTMNFGKKMFDSFHWSYIGKDTKNLYIKKSIY